ncbi:MAG: RDD family protein, partial [Actinomycetota bacterium]|nr:RDD family protein [Actinomycetota bacterium]
PPAPPQPVPPAPQPTAVMPPAAVQPAVQPPAAVTPPPAAAPGAGYPKGPLGARLLAWIADGIIAGALLPVAALLIAAASASEDVPVVGLLLALVGVVWQLAYFLGRDVLGGSGFGKRLAGIVVVSSETGIPATGGPTIVRQLVLYGLNIIPIIGNFIEPVLVLVDKSGKRLGDKVAKTQVVRASDVAARGVALKTGKGAAIGVLIAALLVMLAGSAIGGVVFARSIAGELGVSDGIVPIESPAEEFAADAPVENPAAEAPAEEPPTQPNDATEWEDQANPLNAETAVDAVGNMLNSLKNDDVAAARTYATRNFQEQESWFFAPAGGALAQFEVADVYQDAALWVVEVDEDWNSGPQKSRYFVIVEDNTPRVDGVEFQD